MRTSFAVAAIAASLISTAAFAASQSDTGAIKTLDAAKHQLTLADGKNFQLPTTWKSAGFKVGDKVLITYEMQNGKMVASSVAHAS